jgi:hypothetical protein
VAPAAVKTAVCSYLEAIMPTKRDIEQVKMKSTIRLTGCFLLTPSQQISAISVMINTTKFAHITAAAAGVLAHSLALSM